MNSRHASMLKKTTAQRSDRHFQILCALIYLYAPLAFSEENTGSDFVDGPSAGLGFVNPASIHEKHSSGDHFDYRETSQHTSIHLFYPLSTQVFNRSLKLIPKIDMSQEQRFFSGSTEFIKTPQTSSTLGLGLVFLQNGLDHDYALSVERYGNSDLFRSVQPMTEVLGAIIFKKGPQFADFMQSAQMHLAIRWRHFPNDHQYLPIVGYKFKTTSRWYLDLSVPSHFLTGVYLGENNRTTIYGGVVTASREYPYQLNRAEMNETGWISGYVAQVIIGGRYPLSKNLDLVTEAGTQMQYLRFRDLGGSKTAESISDFAPMIRLALQTVFPTP